MNKINISTGHMPQTGRTGNIKLDSHAIRKTKSSGNEYTGITDNFDSVSLSASTTHSTGHHEETGKLHSAMKTAHVGAEITHAFHGHGWLGGIAGTGAIAAGIYFGIYGAKHAKEAIKHKDAVKGIEAGGHLAFAGKVALETAAVFSGRAAAAGIIGPAAGAVLHSAAVSALGMALGAGHGAAEMFIGGKELFEGIKEKDKSKIIKGAANTGIGAAVTAIAIGGGPAAGAALGLIFGTKLIAGKILGINKKRGLS